MAMSWAFLAILGLAALLTTVAVFVLEIANAQTPRSIPNVQTAAAVATAFEGLVLLAILLLVFMSFRHSTYYGSNKLGAVWFPLCLVTVSLATVASIVVLVILGKENENAKILGGEEMPYLIGTSIALGFAFTLQLAFVVIYFVGSRLGGRNENGSQHPEVGRLAPQMRMKSVPYAQTAASSAEPKGTPSFDLESPPGTSSGRSMAETMSSIRSSLSHAVRPMDSRTRLLPARSTQSIRSIASRGRRQPSFESFPDVEEGFDSWDTSSVDIQTRQIIDTSSPPGTRFLGALETIPASPTVSRSPSPGTPLDLEPPKRAARRSRSYSPVPRPPPALDSNGSTSDLHIHPLFRADSPTPPPAATLGTVIVAAPDAARTLSTKTLHRMRSGSLPASSSPLSRQSSYNSMKGESPTPGSGYVTPTPIDPIEEREMTPPLPEWILNAGARSSLTEYQSRKLRDLDRESKVDSGLGILP
ncbi:hypothetical protein BKA67DRAFT_266146 [Truncatella angustata]|uniref:Uncharacterized protein n=1 Tax=Truncatella angustata TaxID=152316 RepID=A0A9P8UKQ2_9PEZI|nr:uncharacterized protein BKA67DRAFT_266146 [Truncatella angustata]KAH6653968.1 hypothetical protein BKA67DRAFT_266146 [Truncatella angustata]KAH8198048.1 hypothetical protein TruAng_007772 [Truncatella angustata]